VFAKDAKVWLKATAEREDVSAWVLEFKRNTNNEWVYKLRDADNKTLFGGTFFNEDDLGFR
jgi:hypothetical protein